MLDALQQRWHHSGGQGVAQPLDLGPDGSEHFGTQVWSADPAPHLLSRHTNGLPIMMIDRPSELVNAGGRYWDRTSDLFGVNYAKQSASTCGNTTPQVDAGLLSTI